MVLERAGASVTATGAGLLTVTGLATGQISALLGRQAVPFSELSAHRATLEEAYLGLTQRRGGVPGRATGGPAMTATQAPPPAEGSLARAGQLRRDAPGGVDQVPHRARLGDRHDRRRAGDRGDRAACPRPAA